MEGMSFVDFIAMSKKDAESQEALFDVIVNVLEKEVAFNDEKLVMLVHLNVSEITR